VFGGGVALWVSVVQVVRAVVAVVSGILVPAEWLKLIATSGLRAVVLSNNRDWRV
jgi:hypothetical protein